MYRAKAEGGNRCRFSSDQLERRARRGALLASDLRRALEVGEFVLHFQPQVRLTAGRLGIAGVLRWQHPELGLIGAERFLPLAEDAGLLEPLTDRLLELACAQGRAWQDLTAEELHLAIPLLSRRQLAWSGLASRLADCLARAGLPPRCLEIELDEELLLGEVAAGGAGLAALKATGVRLALDRYGEGLTSLRGLRLGMLDTLKLACELHRDVASGGRAAALVGALIALARELGLRVVAEGVEGQEQLTFLRRRGCHAVQAFMSCPPLPADACTSWLRQALGYWRPRQAARAAGEERLPALVSAGNAPPTVPRSTPTQA
jgi:EAL domain-containing protein (putative c-di-GMP-specific phosphodiesterase class I)